MTGPAQRFYRFGDLPPRPEDVERVRRTLRRKPATRQGLVERTGLSQSRAFCAVDALIATGEVVYDEASKEFSTRGQEG